jgi:hypothetical protein
MSTLLKDGPLLSAEGYLGENVREGPSAVNRKMKVTSHDSSTATLSGAMRFPSGLVNG